MSLVDRSWVNEIKVTKVSRGYKWIRSQHLVLVLAGVHVKPGSGLVGVRPGDY